MKRVFACTLTVLSTFGVPVEAEAEGETSTVSSSASERRNTVTFTYGTYTLAERHHSWARVDPSALLGCCKVKTPIYDDFDPVSHYVFGLEYERSLSHGFSYGATYFHARNTFSVPAYTPSQGVADSHLLFATFSKYFGAQGGLQPFIGIGGGIATSRLSGSVNQSAAGFAAMARFGLRYQVGSVSLVAGYRQVRTLMGMNETDPAIGSTTGNMDAGGRGAYGGIGVRF